MGSVHPLYLMLIQTIARRLQESKQNIPHYYLTVDINMDKLLEYVQYYAKFPELLMYLSTTGYVSSLTNRVRGNISSRWTTSWSRQLLYQWARCQRWTPAGRRTTSDSTTRWMWVWRSALVEDSSLQLYLEQNQKWANEIILHLHDCP